MTLDIVGLAQKYTNEALKNWSNRSLFGKVILVALIWLALDFASAATEQE